MGLEENDMVSPSAINGPKRALTPSKAKKEEKHVEVGRIMSVGSSTVVISVNKSIIRNNQLNLVELGTVLKILTNSSLVVAMVSTLKVGGTDDEGMHDGCIAHLSIMGEISTNKPRAKPNFSVVSELSRLSINPFLQLGIKN